MAGLHPQRQPQRRLCS